MRVARLSLLPSPPGFFSPAHLQPITTPPIQTNYERSYSAVSPKTSRRPLSLSTEELHPPGYLQHCLLYPVNTPNRGVGGAYFIKDGDQPAAVFKPLDEEALPDEEQVEDISLGKEIKPGLLYGEGYLKEVAASLLDKDNFHNVPKTVLFGVKQPVLPDEGALGPKLGSLQQYVSHSSTAEDMGWSSFPVDEVHKIGILDCRLLNNDRHLGNILVVKEPSSPFSIRSTCRLVPIDHGLCLPSSLSGGYFGWLSFSQCKQPFGKTMLEHIEKLNVDADTRRLEKNLPWLRKECLETLKICTVFLQKSAKAGLNLFEIGCMMSRYKNMDEPCVLETLCESVKQRMQENEESTPDTAAGKEWYWEALAAEMDAVLYKYCNHL